MATDGQTGKEKNFRAFNAFPFQTLPKKTLLTKSRSQLVTFNTKFLTLKGPNEKGCGEIAVQMNHRYDTPDTEKFNLEDFEWDRAIEVSG